MDLIRYKEVEQEDWANYLKHMNADTFIYSYENIKFQTQYAKTVISNESFILLQDRKPVVIAYAYIDEDADKGIRTISWGGRYCPAPIVDIVSLPYKLQEKYIKKALECIDDIAKKYNCSQIYLQMDPLNNPENVYKIYNYNFLSKAGYRDTSGLTQMLELTPDAKELYSDIRKGHKCNIKNAHYNITFYDADNITKEVIEEYKRIYELDAGRVTRNSEMYMSYYEFVKNNKGIVAIANNGVENIAVLIATFSGTTAYYNSYAEVTEKLQGIPVGHQLQWETIQELKNRGIRFYELGEQLFGTYSRGSEEEKLVNISTYKRGFGGYTVPVFRGVKEL